MRRIKREIVSVNKERDALLIKYESLLSRNHLLTKELARIRQQNIELRSELSDYKFKELKRNSSSLEQNIQLSPVKSVTDKKSIKTTINKKQNQQNKQSEIIVGSDENKRNITNMNVSNQTAQTTSARRPRLKSRHSPSPIIQCQSLTSSSSTSLATSTSVGSLNEEEDSFIMVSSLLENLDIVGETETPQTATDTATDTATKRVKTKAKSKKSISKNNTKTKELMDRVTSKDTREVEEIASDIENTIEGLLTPSSTFTLTKQRSEWELCRTPASSLTSSPTLQYIRHRAECEPNTPSSSPKSSLSSIPIPGSLSYNPNPITEIVESESGGSGDVGVGRRSLRATASIISYTEPSLTTKVRKGHEFFKQKKNN